MISNMLFRKGANQAHSAIASANSASNSAPAGPTTSNPRTNPIVRRPVAPQSLTTTANAKSVSTTAAPRGTEMDDLTSDFFGNPMKPVEDMNNNGGNGKDSDDDDDDDDFRMG